MKKVFSLFLILIFFVFSCAGTPKKDKGADDDKEGLSQLELTAEEDEVEPGADFDDESQDDESQDNENMPEEEFTEDSITDDSQISEDIEVETDDFTADTSVEEQPLAVEIVDAEKAPDEKTPSAPVVTAVQPPPEFPVTAEESPPVTDELAEEQPVQEQQDIAEGKSAVEQVPPRSQPWLVTPPAVTAVKDDAPVPNRQALLPPGDEIVFSRTVRATVGQIVEIPFRGTGWVYLGELASRRGLVYNSRRLDPDGQSFIFRAEEAGSYALKFYRQDFIRDYILNDYVQVIVGESSAGGGAGWFNPPIDRGRVIAEPRWPSALDEGAILRGGQSGAKGAAADSAPEKESATSSAPSAAASANRDSAPSRPQETVAAPSSSASANRESTLSRPQETATTPSSSATPPVGVTPQITAPEIPKEAADTPVQKQEKLPPEEILKKAQETFDEGNTGAAIALLDQFMEYYPNGSDEIYWLYGQFYEANTPYRNIKLSLDYYRRLVNEYPQSRRYNDARRRIAYLERFYINIQ
ncbi:MAG: hypothetical protein LBI04_08935 [Treponema sp.]|jgi:hypothetical protein|nr:hypothetical protein [Treponema sp.]